MLKIRLQRVGRKHDPSFRLVVTESTRGPKSGNFIEILGSHNPTQKERTQLKADRIEHWISKGAKPSDTVHNLLINQGVIKGEKINVLPRKSPQISEEEKTEEKITGTEEKTAESKESVEQEKTEETQSEEVEAKEVDKAEGFGGDAEKESVKETELEKKVETSKKGETETKEEEKSESSPEEKVAGK